MPCRVTRAGLAPGEVAPELHPLHGMLQAGIFLLKAWNGLETPELEVSPLPGHSLRADNACGTLPIFCKIFGKIVCEIFH